ncbi:MAG: 1-acyl-sn-glycerol-3-phosphate acyltransferase [Clostridiales bacterium]|nr:1-acyl-sn-glycerol-3-phosphate acyltransferase [Clostridiales bacterium]
MQGIPVLGIEYLIMKKDPMKSDMQCLHMVQWGFSVINHICGVTTTVIGHENVPTDRPVLYVANHNSYFDIMITYTFCENRTGYIAKDTLEKVPQLNRWMKRLYCLFMNRDDMRQSLQVILDGIELIQKGISVCIFPEGTRGTSEEMLPFKNGSMKIAERTGCPVIPIAISGTRNIIGDHAPKAVPSHVVVEYGDPIYTDQLSRADKKALGRITQERIQAMLDRAKAECLV